MEKLSNGVRDHCLISDYVSPSAPAPLKQPFVIGTFFIDFSNDSKSDFL